MVKKIGVLSLLLSLLLPVLTSCGAEREKIYYQYFDTVITVSVTYGGARAFEKNTAAAEEEIAKYHKLFDIYHEYSGVNNLCTVNRAAGKTAVPIDTELYDFLVQAKNLYAQTNGHMNVMMGAVTSLWNKARDNVASGASALPTEAALAEAKKHIAIDSLVLDREKQTAYISDPAASLDVGAFGKGYAAERVSEHLVSLGVDGGYVLDFGGNLRVIGAPHDREYFTAGIHDPRTAENSGKHVLRLSMKNNALVTSGSYIRYFEIAGKRYHHLIDPETGYPASTFTSVSILGPDSGVCDALSTALFVMTQEEGDTLLDSMEGYGAVWIYPDGKIVKSDGIEPYILSK